MNAVPTSPAYPARAAERNGWIAGLRSKKSAVEPGRPYAFMVEQERSATGEMVPIATLFLTNRECPWLCLMCDLWKNTTDDTVPVGAIPQQIRFALGQLAPAREIKLYNSGSFFDPNAIPREDWPEIARLVRGFERVIVECHPALVGPRCVEFRDLLEGKLEVAMGLETAHPETLEKLNKRMSLEGFARASDFLAQNEIDLRVFILVGAPFGIGADWTLRSIEFALAQGASVVSLIPTRVGNGALEELQRQGLFEEPTIAMVENAQEFGIRKQGARVFADLWDLRRFSRCERCFEARQARLHRMNCEQRVLPRVECACGT